MRSAMVVTEGSPPMSAQTRRFSAATSRSAVSGGALSVAGGSIVSMSESTAFDWRPFLLKYSGEWADSLPDDE